MPYVVPFSSIELCNVPGLDNTYQHTLNFNDASTQLYFFRMHAIDLGDNPGVIGDKTLGRQNYIRINRTGVSKVRVELPLSIVSHANYMILYNVGQNSDTGIDVHYEQGVNEFYYAFINDYQYVSETVTEIEFELDVIQSYLFNYDELPCMVLREHVNSDYAGEHITGEPVEIGPVITRSFEQDDLFKNYLIVVATAYPGS